MSSEEMVSLDWVNIGWGWGHEISPTPSQTLPLTMDFSASVENDLFPLDATINAIRRIAEEYPAPYTLMVSGGIDSQAMTYAWLRSGVPFKLLSVIYVDGDGKPLNTHDLETLIEFANRHELGVEYKNFPVIDFLENQLDEYAITHQCTSPQICTHMKMSEMVDSGTAIFSGNAYIGGPRVNYTILGLLRYTKNTGRSIIPFFFMHDPEMVGSFQYFYKLHKLDVEDYQQKCNMFNAAGFPVIPQTEKLTGFERIKDLYDKRSDLVTLRDRMEFSKYPSRRIFDLRFRYRFTRSVKYVDQIINIPPRGITHEVSD